MKVTTLQSNLDSVSWTGGVGLTLFLLATAEDEFIILALVLIVDSLALCNE